MGGVEQEVIRADTQANTWTLARQIGLARRDELLSRKRGFRVRRRAAQSTRAAQALLRRYSGLISEIADQAGILADRDRLARLEIFAMRIFFKLRDGTYGDLSDGRFCTTLWRCLQAQLSADQVMAAQAAARIAALKRRFMLRQFVDEMSHGEERRLLSNFIFAPPRPQDRTSAPRVLERLPLAALALHDAVRRHAGMIGALTDQAINEDDIASAGDDERVARLYAGWLVPSCP